VPDPNGFGGQVLVRRPGDADWVEMPSEHQTEINRGTGVADMAYALQSGRPHRASGALAYHVLDIMHALHDTSATGQYMELTSGIERPAALTAGLALGILDE